ncbi:hypothetical protein EON65_56730 [archaeon]|nr:MAG: hypothetical protein EON65_56730 [archaeon]
MRRDYTNDTAKQDLEEAHGDQTNNTLHCKWRLHKNRTSLCYLIAKITSIPATSGFWLGLPRLSAGDG